MLDKIRQAMKRNRNLLLNVSKYQGRLTRIRAKQAMTNVCLKSIAQKMTPGSAQRELDSNSTLIYHQNEGMGVSPNGMVIDSTVE